MLMLNVNRVEDCVQVHPTLLRVEDIN